MSITNEPLGDLVKVVGGFAFKSIDFSNDGFPVVRISDIQNGIVNLTKAAKIPAERIGRGLQYRVEPGDILIAMSGATTGKIGIVPQGSATEVYQNQRVGNFKIYNEQKLHKAYLKSFLRSPNYQSQISNAMTGVAQPNISSSQLESIKIPLPPLAEQKRIAAVLDKADELRRKRRLALRKLDQLTRSLFLEMFGDPVTNPKGFPVGTIRELVSSVNYGTSQKADYTGKFPILRMNNITYQGGWNFADLKYIDLSENEYEKFFVRKGDLLFNRTNSKELVGKAAVYREDEKKAFAGYLIRVRANAENNNEYISAVLNSAYGKKTLLNMCKSIVGMANINAQELQDIRVVKPPQDLQNKYANVVQIIEQMKAQHKLQLGKLNELFQSLQQRAFRGDLFGAKEL